MRVPSPATRYDAPVPHDLFISHASEDKAGLAEPLVVALRDRGVSVWYDCFDGKLGDDLRLKTSLWRDADSRTE